MREHDPVTACLFENDTNIGRLAGDLMTLSEAGLAGEIGIALHTISNGALMRQRNSH